MMSSLCYMTCSTPNVLSIYIYSCIRYITCPIEFGISLIIVAAIKFAINTVSQIHCRLRATIDYMLTLFAGNSMQLHNKTPILRFD